MVDSPMTSFEPQIDIRESVKEGLRLLRRLDRIFQTRPEDFGSHVRMLSGAGGQCIGGRVLRAVALRRAW